MKALLLPVLLALFVTRACGSAGQDTAAAPDPAASELLFPIDTSWGMPPQQDWPIDILPAIELKGWYRHLGAGSHCELLALGPDRLVLSGDDAVIAYSLADGSMLWAHAVPRGLYPDSVQANADMISILSMNDTIVISTRDGNSAPVGGPPVQTADGWQVASFERSWSEAPPGEQQQSGLRQAKLASDLGLRASAELDSKTHVVLLAESYPAQHDYWGVNAHLLVLELDDAGQPQAGSAKMLDQPERPRELIKRFMDAPRPLEQKALMSALVASGVNGCQGLCEQLDRMDSAQLDALLGLSIYISMQQQEEYGAYPPVELFYTRMEQLHDPAHVPKLIEWVGRDELAPGRTRMLGLIANTASSEAGEFLSGYYPNLSINEISLTPPPYTPVQPTPYGGDAWQVDDIPPTYNAAAALDDGSLLTAFVTDGLASERAIFLGVDRAADGSYDEILPTGLSDVFFRHVHPGGVQPRSSAPGKLGLSVAGAKLSFSFNSPVFKSASYSDGGQSHSYEIMEGAKADQAELTLEALRKDSDGDGLTDLLEAQLLLDPGQADSDADGLSDSLDAAPNVDSTGMGVVERGAARALAYYFQTNPYGEAWWRKHVNNIPWSARFISVNGLGPVAFGGVEGAWGICLSTAEQQQQYQQLLNGYNAFTLVEVGYEDHLPVMPNSAGLAAMSGAPGRLPDYMWSQADPDQAEQITIGEAASESPAQPRPATGLPGKRSVLWLNFALEGLMIQLVEIDGELYPVRDDQTWIS